MLVWVVTLVTLGSGLIDLYSVMGPSLPERRRVLREIFPLAVLSLSRFFTLLIGFALVIASINLFKRKKRAFQAVFLLAGFSIVFHLLKGVDYEEALFALVLLALLVISRKRFRVKSSLPDWRGAVARFMIAVSVAVCYGVLGFWILDPRHFGVDFNWRDSIHQTVHFLLLIGDPEVTPRTRYASWFVDSLYLMTATWIAYSVFALFRPVVYRYATHAHECALARRIVGGQGRSPQDFFKSWPDKSFFFLPSRSSFLAYSVGRSFAVVLGDPVGPEAEAEEIIRQFSGYCRDNDWGLGFHQVLPDFLAIYRRLGFKKLKIGDEAIVDLRRFAVGGKKAREMRRIEEKLGVRSRLYEPPVADDVLAQVKEVSDEWLQIPGRRERQFSLGKFEPHYIRSTPVFAAADGGGKILAFVNIIPSYRRGEATIDLMRRRTQAPNGIMDYLFFKLFLFERERGYERFNLGLAPMSGFQEKEEASPEERAVHYFFQHLNFLFSYRGLKAYKARFASYWEPRYEIYRTALDLPRLAIALGRVSEINE